MSIEKVREYLKIYGKDGDIKELSESSATVALAAHALGTEPARIAKTLSFESKEQDGCILVVCAGDMKIDNSKFKQYFGFKAKMLGAEEVSRLTGHAAGGVCPFANPENTKVFLDVSMRRFETVFPACGSSNSAIELALDELEELSGCKEWIDVCKPYEVQA